MLTTDIFTGIDIKELEREQLQGMSEYEVYMTSYIRLPSKLNKYSEISEALEDGLSVREVAWMFDLSDQTIYNYRKKGLI